MVPFATLMRKLLTGYAQQFSKRHGLIDCKAPCLANSGSDKGRQLPPPNAFRRLYRHADRFYIVVKNPQKYPGVSMLIAATLVPAGTASTKPA